MVTADAAAAAADNKRWLMYNGDNQWQLPFPETELDLMDSDGCAGDWPSTTLWSKRLSIIWLSAFAFRRRKNLLGETKEIKHSHTTKFIRNWITWNLEYRSPTFGSISSRFDTTRTCNIWATCIKLCLIKRDQLRTCNNRLGRTNSGPLGPIHTKDGVCAMIILVFSVTRPFWGGPHLLNRGIL